jgi:hypothetical protein
MFPFFVRRPTAKYLILLVWAFDFAKSVVTEIASFFQLS